MALCTAILGETGELRVVSFSPDSLMFCKHGRFKKSKPCAQIESALLQAPLVEAGGLEDCSFMTELSRALQFWREREGWRERLREKKRTTWARCAKEKMRSEDRAHR
jgi:hypothetical protein